MRSKYLAGVFYERDGCSVDWLPAINCVQQVACCQAAGALGSWAVPVAGDVPPGPLVSAPTPFAARKKNLKSRVGFAHTLKT